MVGQSAELTNSNLFTQSYANIFNLVNDKDNVPDPLNASSTRQMVYSRVPDSKDQKFEGYPFIIVWPTDVGTTVYSKSAGSSKKGFNNVIEVRCTDKLRGKEGGGKPSTAMVYIDTISNALYALFENADNRKILLRYCQGAPEIVPEPVDSIFVDGDTVWIRRLTLRSEKRIGGA